MNKQYVEYWPHTHNIAQVAGEIARHLQVRQSLGSAVVLAHQPVAFLSAIRKHWIKLHRALQRERSKTLDPALRAALTREIERMQKLRFVAKPPHEANADVFIVAPESIPASLPLHCRTLYAHHLVPDTFESFLQKDGVMVQYSLQDKPR